nr:retrovirus-related Pol polyprotein from transposon TNT 1-94 [Tanacetum cinerariifolium]
MIENHLVDMRLKDVLMMVLVMHTEEDYMVLHIEKTGMLMLVVEIDVGGMTAVEVDKLNYLYDDVQPKKVDLRYAHALTELHWHDIHVDPDRHEVDQLSYCRYSYRSRAVKILAVVTSWYPITNNHLRTSSNPRQQANINNGRVTIQPIQGRQNSMTAGSSRPYTSGSTGTSRKKRIYKQLYDSIKSSHVRSKEQCDDLIKKVNLKSVEVSDLNVRLQKKVLVITALKEQLDKLKGKAVITEAVSLNPIDPKLLKIDVTPVVPKLRKNRMAHIDYIRNTQGEAATLRKIVESERLLSPLNTSLDYACKYTRRIQELLVILQQTCPYLTDIGTKLETVIPKNTTKQIRQTAQVTKPESITITTLPSTNLESNKPVISYTGVNLASSASGSMSQDNTKNNRIPQIQNRAKKNKVEDHLRTVKSSLNKASVVDSKATSSVLNSVSNVNSNLNCASSNGCFFSDNNNTCVNASKKSKSVKTPVIRKIWKTTGKVFKTVGHIWKPTGRTFTLVGNVCPLTMIATPTIVPPREPIPIVNKTDIPVVTLYLDSDCSKHMTRDRSQLINFVQKFLGMVKFGNDHVAKIMGYGDYQIGNVTISRVYYVEGLGHNLFSVRQFCDSDLEVAFRQHTCFIRNLKGVDLLTGTVKFGNDHVAKITGYGDYQIGNVTISRVYYVEGLGHNLFSVGQFCDSDLEVAFRQHSCFIRNLKGVDLLTGSRGNNLYTLSLQDLMASSPICLLSKASKTKSWLWHRRLSHLNFGAINNLARQGLVRGLPKLKFEKDHLCSACAMGKSTKKSHKPKSEDTNQEKLYLLHMDLCGPMRVESVNGKKYILVIVDEYSRFTWVKFLRSKDETPMFIIKFLKMIQVRLNVPARHNEDDDNNEEDQGLRIGKEERMQDEEDAEELYRDVDINQGRGLQVSQETEDSHVILTPTQSDTQQERSSTSSFMTNLLNPITDPGMESIFTTSSTTVTPIPSPQSTMTPSIISTFTSDDDQEGPSAGSDRGSKRRREGGEHASASTPSEPATRSAGRSTTWSQSRLLSASESAFAEEPVQPTCQMEESSHPPSRPPTPDRNWNKYVPAAQGNAQSWITTLAKQTDARSSFNELLDTLIDFSIFIMNRLGVDTLTPELLAGPTYELMRGSCNSLTDLEYHLEEVYKT